jgi:hypothetical protein
LDPALAPLKLSPAFLIFGFGRGPNPDCLVFGFEQYFAFAVAGFVGDAFGGFLGFADASGATPLTDRVADSRANQQRDQADHGTN